jgi:hypothetical protein
LSRLIDKAQKAYAKLNTALKRVGAIEHTGHSLTKRNATELMQYRRPVGLVVSARRQILGPSAHRTSGTRRLFGLPKL